MKIQACAKINLSLDVLSKRADGYHNLQMLMQEIALYDTIYVEKAENITVSSNKNLPCDQGNIAWRVAERFFAATGICGGAEIKLEKEIPMGAGLGGGSADGAAVLKALNILYDTNLSLKQMIDIGKEVGADIPFCLMGGCALAEGIGERLTPLPPIQGVELLLVKPQFSVSTREVFQALRLNEISRRPNHPALLDALGRGDARFVAGHMVNVLEEVTEKLYPQITEIKQKLLLGGAMGAVMSGSGSTVFGLFEPGGKAAEICASFHDVELARVILL